MLRHLRPTLLREQWCGTVLREQWYGGGNRLESLRRMSEKSGSGEGDAKKPWYQSIRDVMNETKEKVGLKDSSKPKDSNESSASEGPSSANGGGGAGSGGGSSSQAGPPATPARAGGGDGNSREGSALIKAPPERRHHKLLVVELNRKPLFPGIYAPVMVNNNAKLIKEILDAKKAGGQAYVGAFLRRPEPHKPPSPEAKAGSQAPKDAAAEQQQQQQQPELMVEVPPPKPAHPQDSLGHLYEVGTFAQVHTILTGEASDSGQLLLLGHRRIKRTEVLSQEPQRVRVEHLRDEPYSNDDILKATSMEVVNTMRDLLHLNPLYGEQFRTLLSLTGSIDLQDMSRLVDAAASLTSGDDVVHQAILEQLSVPERAKSVLLLLKKEVELCKLQQDIREQVEGKIMKEQRRMMLMEQLRSIKKELGLEKDDKSALVQRFQARWEAKADSAPEEVNNAVSDELAKLSGLEPASPEFNVTRNYLDWLTILPWGTHTQEKFDLGHARQVLDDDHYGLEDVKERIMEFIAVSGLRGTAQGKILCLVGPPGVGKTSIGRSIARTLERKYFRFSVGGLYDVAEIKGHRRTYVGAMPGKMVQCLKSVGSSNPLVLIDEIDKLGRGHTGDPASALLELLDPEQNTGFVDHYLDVPVDLSKVLFVCTANVLDTIPGPLLDRMEVIRLSGYSSDEKLAIARRYLEPQAAKDAGVPEGAVRLNDEAMHTLINEYCREAGVRNLKKQLEKVYRKAALRIVKDGSVSVWPVQQQHHHHHQAEPRESEAEEEGSQAEGTDKEPPPAPAAPAFTGETIVVDKEALKPYLGQPPFSQDRFYESCPPGVVMGLAWTAMGGSTLYVEAAQVVTGATDKEASGRGGVMTTTGQLGDVFRESATIAHTFARSYMATKDINNKFLTASAVHVHVPQGATPKDGPSAGCTIVTALLSLALNKPVAPDLAMTGEVTLTGRVLPIGGVKEKILAARRSGVKKVIFPQANRADYDELPAYLKENLSAHFVTHYDEVFKLALEYDGEGAQQPHAAASA
mmetsp:Transcript_22464/g.62033  ORF Transcript_22464/g.62033 Transcript_22464/m.62033 type:complete len:1027 (-) Transcript_22464:288-3368(-)